MEKTLDESRDQMLLENIAAFGQYSNGLIKASEKCRADGDLDGVVALTSEIKRVSRAVAIPSEDDGETPESVRVVRGEYRAAIGKSKAAFERKEQALLQGYVADLETLKKRLTVEGKIEEALAVKEAIASQKPLVEVKPPVVAPPVPNEEMVPCGACSGVGKKLGPCAKCSGTGVCVICSGAGVRKQMMTGMADRMPCMACRKTGKCAPCGGTGKVPGQACEVCRGVGKVTK
jgi:hypothetical protein